MFQNLIFRKIFSQYIEIVKNSFQYIGRQVENDWRDKREGFYLWFQSENIQSTFLKYLNTPEENIRINQWDMDRQRVMRDLNLQFENNEECAFFVINLQGNMVFSSNYGRNNHSLSSLELQQRLLFVELQNQIRSYKALDSPTLQFDSSSGNGINVFFIEPMDNPENNELLGLVLVSIKNNQLKNKDLDKLIAEKDKFFSIIAHDLKTPFNSILG
ncbi:MAG: hypothetical protein PF447_09485, partial [Spirochaetaceae bacterium]|nr:hypothetical protein [Spirochaetaceae bacterium]